MYLNVKSVSKNKKFQLNWSLFKLIKMLNKIIIFQYFILFINCVFCESKQYT